LRDRKLVTVRLEKCVWKHLGRADRLLSFDMTGTV
jgi:hypothetical protein